MCSKDWVWSISDTDEKFGLRRKVMRGRLVDMGLTRNEINMVSDM
jgi:hypothetical protein